MIDHIIFADPDLARGIATFSSRYGIVPSEGGRHLGFGTRNALVGLGEGAYLEIMSVDPEQDVPAGERFFALEATSVPRFAAWCARADRPLTETVAIARDFGIDLGEIIAMSRRRPDGSVLSWTLTSPFAPRESVLPFYIDWGGAPNPGLSLSPQLALHSLTVAHPDSERMRRILDALGEHEVRVERGPEPTIRVSLARTAS